MIGGAVDGLSFGPSRISRYSIPVHWIVHGRNQQPRRDRISLISPEEKAKRARARVISRYWQAIGYLWLRTRRRKVTAPSGAVIPFRQGFLTLTLPGQATSDHKAVKKLILDPFLTYARNVLGLQDYVWTAEIQPTTGRIHFHVLINQFMDKDLIRKAWNGACERSGIITPQEGNKPSTEVEAIRSYHGSKSYAAKYLSKAIKDHSILGRVWGASHSVTGFGSISFNEVEDGATMSAIAAELTTNNHVWLSLDHGVKVSRVETHQVTRSRYPILHRYLSKQIYEADAIRAEAIHGPTRVVDRPLGPTDARVAEDRQSPHHTIGAHLGAVQVGVGALAGIMLQASGTRTAERSIRQQRTHFSTYKPGRVRSDHGG
jgi:hypothetical protein